MRSNPMSGKLKLLREPQDMSRDGQCSRCGQCCPSIVCVSPTELDRLTELAKTINPVVAIPDPKNATVYARCPFLIQRQYFPAHCQIYDDRPQICRAFRCWHSNRENAETYLDGGGEAQPAVNLWTLFGLTGLYDESGRPIPSDNPFYVDVDLSGKRSLRLRVGQPVALWTADSRYVPPSLIVGMSRNGLQIFNNNLHRIEIIPFDRIESLDVPENAVHARPKGPRKRNRHKERNHHHGTK